MQRIVLEMLGVTLSKDARARAIQLPAWNEALGLPRPWDQQWSLRMQQVLAYESDLLEYPDLFEGSVVVEAKTAELVAGARAELARDRGDGRGGRGGRDRLHEVRAGRLARGPARPGRVRRGRRRRGQQVRPRPSRTRCWPTWTPPSRSIDPAVEAAAADAVQAWRAGRDDARCRGRAQGCWPRPLGRSENLMPASLECARAGVTMGEWAGDAARGVRRVPGADRRGWRDRASGRPAPALSAVRETVRPTGEELGRAPAVPGRQARPGRALQRRRADRRARPRRRLRGGLPGDPARRRRRSSRPRWPRTCTSSACRSCPARTWSRCPRCCAGCAPRG